MIKKVVNFFKTLGPQFEPENDKGTLYTELSILLPNIDQEELLKVACISGLLARIAYADLEITESEQLVMKKSLLAWGNIPKEEIDAVVTMIVTQTQELAGLENHKYCSPLIELLDETTRFKLLKSLFMIAIGDGHISNLESEEIRSISTALGLSHKYYIAAKVAVKDL